MYLYIITYASVSQLQKKFPRIEKELFPEMVDHPDLYLLSVSWEEDLVQNLVSQVVEVLDRNTVGPIKYIRYYITFCILHLIIPSFKIQPYLIYE